jgi:two-component system chemotaxis response regulator CheB
MKEPKYIIVIGASAGGLQAVPELMAQVTEEMDAAIFVVLHAPNLAYADLVIQRLQKNSVFTCLMAANEEPIRAKHLYVAVPDFHLLLKKGKMLLGRGPVENRWRPSIDVLFRSAAVAYDGRVIGVILTGLLEDGATGMEIIKQCGGTCIVQDPAQAEYPDMPQAVMRFVDVDYCASLQEIAIILQEKARNGVETNHTIPERLKKEAEIAERVAIGIDNMKSVGGDLSPFTCPDCGGSLWEIKDGDISRYRCHTGHMYSQDELLNSKRKELENTFWVALRIMEERRSLLNKMADEERGKGWVKSSGNKQKRADELEEHISRLKELLFNSTDDPDPNRLQLDGK